MLAAWHGDQGFGIMQRERNRLLSAPGAQSEGEPEDDDEIEKIARRQSAAREAAGLKQVILPAPPPV